MIAEKTRAINRARSKAHYHDNLAASKERNNRYYQENKEKVKAQKKVYMRESRKKGLEAAKEVAKIIDVQEESEVERFERHAIEKIIYHEEHLTILREMA